MWGKIVIKIFEPRYILKQHLNATGARKYKDPVIKRIFSEVGNRCPKCNNFLEWGLPEILNNDIDIEKIKIILNSKDNQIAHIYGRKLFEQANMPLSEKYHINDVSELDSYVNLIVLCGNCHKEYDKKEFLTYEKYLDILAIKKRIYTNIDIEKYLYLIFNDFKNDFIQYSKSFKNSELDVENFDKTELMKKLEYNNISERKSRIIKNDNRDYFNIMQYLFENTEDSKELINAFSTTYNELKAIIDNKEDIINKYTEIFVDTYINTAVEIIVAYMIMICEVLDNAPE